MDNRKFGWTKGDVVVVGSVNNQTDSDNPDNVE